MEDVPSGGHVGLEDEVVKDVEEGEDLVERHRHAHGAEELQVLGEEALVQEDPQRHRRLEPKQLEGDGAKVTAGKANEAHSTRPLSWKMSHGLSSVPMMKSSTKPPWVCQLDERHFGELVPYRTESAALEEEDEGEEDRDEERLVPL